MSGRAMGVWEPGAEEAGPLNERIARALQEEIRAGLHPVGATLPTETALCARFEASRFTVREALRKLVEKGLVERRQGAGSTVIATSAQPGFAQVFDDLADMFEYARDTHFDVATLGMIQVDPEVAGFVQAPVGTSWLKAEGVRWTAARDAAICFVSVYVHARFAPLLADLREVGGAVYGLVEARSGELIAEALQEITARPMPPPVARALKRPRGSPAMRFVRRYYDVSGGVMLTSVNWHPGEECRYTTRIRRGEWRA
ncbi:GntR family transcriptional regulator [Methylobacterium aquaticum]|uniref:GntR family transcriptional regulator n=1 Tax=Methylobacterium aquaticum TaxID=270351 RepID=UPI001933381E|nr:GntR family transcriptional regulator [Methylobacterium aquaticum]QRE75021.1 GntR family transcriptional regulator [Methylobacterium aquaticum]